MAVGTASDGSPREIELREDPSGATGGKIWGASRVFADILHERACASAGERQRLPQTVLELGCGTGYLAMRLAADTKGTRVIATDVQSKMKNLKFNVGRNQLRHAVRACVSGLVVIPRLHLPLSRYR